MYMKEETFKGHIDNIYSNLQHLISFKTASSFIFHLLCTWSDTI